MKISDVIEFIKENKKIFDSLQDDLEPIIKANKGLISTTKQKLSLIDDSHARRANLEGKIEFDYKGELKQRNQADMFADVLLNYFHTKNRNKEFKLTSRPGILKNLETRSKMSRKEKLSFVSTLFSLLFNKDYIEDFDIDNLSTFLLKYDLNLYQIDREKPEELLDYAFKLDDNAKTMIKRHHYGHKEAIDKTYFEITEILKDLHLANCELVAQPKEPSKKIKLLKIIKENEDFKSILPDSSIKEVNYYLDEELFLSMTSDISNEFAIKTVFNNMPPSIDEDFYNKFVYNINTSEKNVNLEQSDKDFLIGYLLIKKYGSKNIVQKKYVQNKYLESVYDLVSPYKTKHKKLTELDLDFQTLYIRHSFKIINSISNEINSLFISLYLLSKLEQLDLNYVIQDTKMEFEILAKAISSKPEELQKLYNIKSIKDKSLFIKLKEELNGYYFELESPGLRGYSKEVRNRVSKESLIAAIKEKTINQKLQKYTKDQEPDFIKENEKLFLDICEIFDIK